jgi:small subunit ribosomal protein S2
MFIGTNKAASEAVREVSVKCGQYYVRDCWLPGTISNWSSVAGCVSRLLYLRRLVVSADFFGFVKKERASIWREKDKLEASLSGVVRLKEQPRVIIIVDPVCDKYAFRESLRQGLTVVSIVGTNANPYYVDFPIPGNSATNHPIRLLLSILSLAITKTRGRIRKGRLRVRGDILRKKGSLVFRK